MLIFSIAGSRGCFVFYQTKHPLVLGRGVRACRIKDWLRDRNEAKIKALNKNWLEADFDLLYRNNLAKGCNEEEIERIKADFIEWTELRNELRANGLTPPSPEKTKRIIELELFFNHILEQDRASKGRVMGLFDRVKERLGGHSQQKIEAVKKNAEEKERRLLYIKEMYPAMETDRIWSEEIQHEVKIAEFLNWQSNSLQDYTAADGAKGKTGKPKQRQESTIERER